MENLIYNIANIFTSDENARWFVQELNNNFIVDDRWTWLLDGLWVTVRLTFFSFIFLHFLITILL